MCGFTCADNMSLSLTHCSLTVTVCVCVCVFVRACVRACVAARAFGMLKKSMGGVGGGGV